LNKYEGWLFVPAFAFDLLETKFSIAEMPYTYLDRFGGRSKMNTLSYTKNLLLFAVKYRLKRIFKLFGIKIK
jgi:hypothetical protein